MAGPAHLQATHLSPVVCSSLIIEAHQLQKSSHEKRQAAAARARRSLLLRLLLLLFNGDVRLLLLLLLQLLWRTPVISAAVTAIVAYACWCGCSCGYCDEHLAQPLLLGSLLTDN
jgi:hypothetical protein